MTVLIVAQRHDDHAVPVAEELRRRGHVVHVLDLDDFPQKLRGTVRFETDPKAEGYVLETPTATIDLDDVETVWLRRTPEPNPPALADRWWTIHECNQFLAGLAQTLARCKWVNPLGAFVLLDAGWGKIRQLQAARAVGLEVPRSAITNDPEAARAFVASCYRENGVGAIYKPFSSRQGNKHDGTPSAIFTTDVPKDADFRPVAVGPCIFQEKVAKRFDVRATVMGDRVHAIEVHSQESDLGKTDYRRVYMKARHVVHRLPGDVEARLVRLHHELGLVFGTADLVVTPDDRYVFLETNQQGLWLWTASQTKVDLVSPFCDLLTDH